MTEGEKKGWLCGGVEGGPKNSREKLDYLSLDYYLFSILEDWNLAVD
jgi:hypothetical protein